MGNDDGMIGMFSLHKKATKLQSLQTTPTLGSMDIGRQVFTSSA